MVLQLENKYDDDFIRFLISRKLTPLIINSINDEKLTKIDNFIENIDDYKDDNGEVIITAREAIILGANNLVKRTANDKLIISINPIKNIDGSFAKLIDICKLINDGNSELIGYPIFTNSFAYIKEHIDTIFINYKNGCY